MMNDSFCRIIAGEIQARPEQVDAAVRLLDEGNTVPFIARYRKEITGGLDDTQLRNLETRLSYLRELEERRQAILKSISEQGKLTDDLAKAINATLSKTELEDLYLPYKPKRRTRGQIAIEAGLEPLADLLWSDPSHTPEVAAAQYVDADKGVADTKAALDGARYILMERFAEDAALLAKVRDYLWKNAHLVSTVVSGKEEEGAKFRDYFDHHEPLSTVPSHRALAMFRGRNEGVLQLSLNADPQFDEPPKESYCEQIIMDHLGLRLNNAAWRQIFMYRHSTAKAFAKPVIQRSRWGEQEHVDSLIADRISQLAAVNLLLQPCSQVPNLILHRQRQLRVEVRSLLHIQRRPLGHLPLNLLPNPRAPPIHKGAFQICLRGQTRIAQQHHQRGGVKFI